MKKRKKEIVIDDGYDSKLVKKADFQSFLEIPVIKKPKEFIIPKDTIPFTLMAQSKNFDEFVVFYEHDINFRDFILDIDEYDIELHKFPGLVSPDCSLYRDMPLVCQLSNIYINRACGVYLQNKGHYVIPNIRWGDERTYTTDIFPFKPAFLGIEKHSIVSIGTYGVVNDKTSRFHLKNGLKSMLEELEPEIVLVYGPMPAKIFDEFKLLTTFVHYTDWIAKKKGNSNG